jgi:hypothetical protein
MDIKDNDVLEINGEQDGVEVIDLDGEPFEVIGELEYEGVTYFALIPFAEDEEDEEEELEFVILKEVQENDEPYLATIDDDDFYEKIGELFLKMFVEQSQDD